MASNSLSLGLGLIGIGRPWGHVPGEVPSEGEAQHFLDAAFCAGITYYDTAPSYALSERRLGHFLSRLSQAERARLTIATKFGEDWDFDAAQPIVDHSYAALAASLERSLGLLGRIDVLQLHKTTPEVLASPALEQAWDLARHYGIAASGASVSDAASGHQALAAARYAMLQCPLNMEDQRFLPLIHAANAAGLWVATNRPLAMGRLSALPAAFGYLRSLGLRGVVLSGTRSIAHLHANMAAFSAAAATPPVPPAAHAG